MIVHKEKTLISESIFICVQLSNQEEKCISFSSGDSTMYTSDSVTNSPKQVKLLELVLFQVNVSVEQVILEGI